MKRLHSIISLFLLLALPLSAQTWTQRSAAKWVKQGTWTCGLKDIHLYKGTDMVTFATQYHLQQALWDKVFTWMATHDVATMAPGKYEIDGTEAFANVQDAVLRPAEQVGIESHRKYIDLQWCVTGVERYGIVAPKDATVKVPYSPDIMLWTATKIKYVNSDPKTFFLFFPHNYHRACVLPEGGQKNIRKVCIKIAYEDKL